jgi:outer membrane lipoprotein-sorting protein
MHLRLPCLLLLALAGCSRGPDATATLLADVRQRLAAREGRLTSYQLAGTAHEGAQTLAFTFAYRAPQRMRGTLGPPPASRTFAWNGEQLFERLDAEKRFTTFRDELKPEQRAGLLTQLFSPFVPEGFRAPLLPSQGVGVRRASHPRAPEAVELTVRPTPEVEFTYVLRWPSLDFVAKRIHEGTRRTEIRVEEEQCAPELALCVPRRLTQWADGQQVAQTTLSRVELNPALPADGFTLTPPEGYEVQSRTLVETASP